MKKDFLFSKQEDFDMLTQSRKCNVSVVKLRIFHFIRYKQSENWCSKFDL